MKFKKKELIKSPLNYTGGKYKLLPQILPYFPDNINTFYDLFTGGCNVGINVKANKIVCSDIDDKVINMINYLKNNTNSINELNDIIKKYNLNKINKEGYLKLRKDYNSTRNIAMLLVLIFHSFNNQIRFNKKGEFNLPFGGRTLNDKLNSNLNNFINKIHNVNIEFENSNFKNFNICKLNSNDFVYCDPPYSLAFKEYNGLHFWSKNDDLYLYNMLDKINNQGGKFALSNIFECKGKTNIDLINWSKQYKVIHLDYNYKNCNYVRNNKKDDEVLILNY